MCRSVLYSTVGTEFTVVEQILQPRIHQEGTSLAKRFETHANAMLISMLTALLH